MFKMTMIRAATVLAVLGGLAACSDPTTTTTTTEATTTTQMPGPAPVLTPGMPGTVTTQTTHEQTVP
jgi:ABC-type glycerol-3-phosphate transport system substrate-binding protein